MFNLSTFIHMVRFRTFWVVCIEDLGMIVASPLFLLPKLRKTLSHFIWHFAETYIHLVFLLLWSIVEHGSTLFICGHDSFRFVMAPFFILSDHDSFISYTYVGSAYIFMVMICMWTFVSKRSVFVWHLSLFQVPLFEPFDLGFSALSILNCFLYNVF